VQRTWRINNQPVATTVNPTVTIPAATLASVGVTGAGTFPVLLNVTDGFAVSSTAGTSLVVTPSQAPTARFTVTPIPAAPTQPVTFNASASTPGTGTIVNYRWDFGDGVATTTTTPVVTHPYNKFGGGVFTLAPAYNATLTVTNSAVVTGTASANVVVDRGNQPPVANVGGPYGIIQGGNLVLNSSGSSEPDAERGDQIVLRTWRVNNQSVATTANPTVTIPAATLASVGVTGAGTFPVALNVTDGFNVTGTASTQLTVLPDDTQVGADPSEPPPTGAIAWRTVNPDIGHGDGPFALPGVPNPDGLPVLPVLFPGAQWVPPDRCPFIHLHGPFRGHGDPAPGPPDTVSACGHGALVYIFAQAPTARFTATPSPAACKQAVQFNASTSTPGSGGIVSYQWNFGDGMGATTTAPMTTHAYTAFGGGAFTRRGPYPATLTVTDSNRVTSTAQASIVVDQGNLPPIANANGPYSFVMGSSGLALDATGSSDPNATCGDTLVFEWRVNNQPVATTTSPTITVPATTLESAGVTGPGTFPVVLSVRDGFNVTRTNSAQLTALPPSPPGPTACFTFSTFSVLPTVIGITLDASCSVDETKPRIMSFRWSFTWRSGFASGEPIGVNTTAPVGTTGTITLQVVDINGQSDTTSRPFP
jgi:hypothetical protein